MKQEVPVGVTPKQQHMSRAAEKAEARRARRIARQKQVCCVCVQGWGKVFSLGQAI